MADEQNTETAASETAPAPETAAPETAGTALTGGQPPAASAPETSWRDSLDDDLKSWANKFDSPAAALKSHRELEKRLGKSVVMPGEDAKPEEIQAFRKKVLGTPDSPEGYKLTLPEHVPQEVRDNPLSDPLVQKFVEQSHALGKSPDQVQADLNLFYEAMDSIQEQAQQAAAQRAQQGIDALKQEWRGDFEPNTVYAQRAVKQFDADGQFKQFLETETIGGIPVGNHPAFARFFAKVGRALSEDSVQLEPTETEIASYNEQANAIRAKRNEALARGDQASARRFDEEERAIYARMGNQPIVGTAGRSA